MFDASMHRTAYRRCCLLKLVSASVCPKIGHQENSVCPFKCSSECSWFVLNLPRPLPHRVRRRLPGLRVSPRTLNWPAAWSARTTPTPCRPVAPNTTISFLLFDNIRGSFAWPTDQNDPRNTRTNKNKKTAFNPFLFPSTPEHMKRSFQASALRLATHEEGD